MKTKTIKLKKTIGYIRVSSLQQVEDQTSLERQKEKIKAYCAFKGITNLEFISDEGISGYKTTVRKGYLKLLDLAKSNQIETLIVYDLSRLSRSLKETLSFFDDILRKHNINFVSLNNDIDTTTSTGILFFQITAMFNEFYRNDISYKTKTALQFIKSNKQKTGGTLPFGYVIGLNNNLFEYPQEQKVISLMQDLRNKGCSYNEIARTLNNKNIPTKTKGAKWYAKTIIKILEFKKQFDNTSEKAVCVS